MRRVAASEHTRRRRILFDASGCHASGVQAQPRAGACGLSLRPAVVRALPGLRPRAGPRHLRPQLRLLRSDARVTMGRPRQLPALLHRRPVAANLLEHPAFHTVCRDRQHLRRHVVRAGAQSPHADRPALPFPARLLSAGNHRGGLRLDRLGLLLRRRSRRHQLLPHSPRLQPGALADVQPQRDDVDRLHGRVEERRLLHDHLHRGASGRAEAAGRSGGHGRRVLLAAVLQDRLAVDLSRRLLRHRLCVDRGAAGVRVRS